jgi:hypothetical protein
VNRAKIIRKKRGYEDRRDKEHGDRKIMKWLKKEEKRENVSSMSVFVLVIFNSSVIDGNKRECTVWNM